MGYYVVKEDGARYGPAEIQQLRQWANEGRITQLTILEDEVTGGRAIASSMPELTFASVGASSDGPPPIRSEAMVSGSVGELQAQVSITIYVLPMWVVFGNIGVTLDGREIGKGSLKEGFALTEVASVGTHDVGFGIGRLARHYALALNSPGRWEARAQWNRWTGVWRIDVQKAG